jgi:hypothetical protein
MPHLPSPSPAGDAYAAHNTYAIVAVIIDFQPGSITSVSAWRWA